MKKVAILVVAIGLLGFSRFSIFAFVLSEPPATEWERTYGGSNNDMAFSVIQAADGGYALAGTTESFGAGGYDLCLVKTDLEGNLQWDKTYGGPYHDGADCLLQTNDGGYALVGQFSVSSGHEVFWFVKVDSTGTMQWNKTYEGTTRSHAFSIVQTLDGGYAIGGTTNIHTGNMNSWLVKTDSYGNMQWNKTYGGVSDENTYSILQTSDEGYVLAGHTYSFGAGNSDFWLVKTDASGNVEWNKTYGGLNDDSAESIVQTSDGGYLLAGCTASFGAGSYDFWLVKTNQHGNMEWNKTYGGLNDDKAHHAIQTKDGGYILTGATLPLDGLPWDIRNSDGWLVKVDSAGNIQWNKTYGGPGFDETWSAVQTSDGGYAVTGYTKSFGAGMGDFWLIKIGAVPVGGYAYPIEGHAIANTLAPYIVLVAILTIGFTTIQRKTTRKTK